MTFQKKNILQILLCKQNLICNEKIGMGNVSGKQYRFSYFIIISIMTPSSFYSLSALKRDACRFQLSKASTVSFTLVCSLVSMPKADEHFHSSKTIF